MQKTCWIGICVFLVLMISFQLPSHAQSKKYFVITGKIVPEESGNGSGIIEITKNDKDKSTIEIPKSGRFRLELDFFNEFSLNFKYPGHFNKIILVTTQIPQDVWERDNDFPAFPMIVQLFKEFEGIDKSFTLKPVAKIFYGKAIDNFDKESYFSDIQVQEQIATAKSHTDQVQKEAQSILKENAQDLAAKQRNYDQLIKEADTEYQRGEYQVALLKYQDAKNLFPDRAYPTDRVAELQELVKALENAEKQKAELEEKYKNAIALGNKFFEQKQYLEAKPNYQEALQHKPGDIFSSRRINEIDLLLAQMENQKRYKDLIDQADKNYQSKNYDQAISFYNQAKQVLPEENYPDSQISRINLEKQEQAKLDQLEKDFNQIMQTAGNSARQKDYLQALNFYQKALELKPNNQLAIDKIAEMNKAIVELENDKKYLQAIQLADQALASNDLERAKAQYQEAIRHKANETYPKNKLAEISVAEANKLKFEGLVSNAEKAFSDKNFEEALNYFNQALTIKSQDKSVLKRIEDIQAILKQQLADKEYTDLIARADQSFESNDFITAKTGYQSALKIKPNDLTAKEKLGKTEAKLAEIARLTQAYNKAIDQANAQLTAKKYPEAKEKYQEALQYQPKEEYPKQQIAKIDIVLAQLEADAKLKRDFDQTLAEGENLLKTKELDKAKEAFVKAYNLIPSEPLPPKRISEIDALLAEQARKDSELKTRLEAYQAAIQKADNLFGNKEYNSAMLAYKEALLIKPDEKYPVDQLALIEGLLKKQIEQNYKDLIASGDNSFNANQLDEAAVSYKEALKFKKDDQYATNRLKEIEQRKNELEAENIRLKKLEDQYQALITDANKDFENKVYPDSKGKYQKALVLKPAESYPKDQIARIDQILAEQQNADETNKKYNQYIKDAETAFKQKKLKEARDLFQNGSNLKPNEPLPPLRIAEIDKMLAQLDETAKLKAMEDAQRLAKEKADRQQFENEIAAGDKAFTAKEYKVARLHYTSALAVLPTEKYPSDQIAKIDELLLQEEMNKSVAQQKATQDSLLKVKNQMFDSALALAKEHEQNNRYNQAIEKYNEAISIKPEQRPTIQKYIKEIEDRIQLLAKRDQDYQVVIKLADNYFTKTDLENALTQYKKASTIKPDEEYPKTQISLIESQLTAREENYLAAIKSGDEAFDASDWTNAKTAYTNALDIKPKEQYPLNRLKEVNRKISEANLAAIKNDAENKAYKEAIEKAQNLLDQDQLTSSRTQFQVAQTLKPNETLPAEKIAEIDALLEKRNNDRLAQAQRELDEKYRQAISVADISYKEKSYPTARIQYQQALLIKPEEAYPKDQMALIDKIVSEARAAEKAVVKPTPKPVNIPEETAQATESRALAFKTVTDYDEAVKKADESFGIKDYSVARFYYYKASDIKPAEGYPKKQIELIRKLIDSQLTSGDITAYEQAITQADNAFSSKNYTVAKFFYYKALGIKSWEQYPKDRINEILALTNSLLSEREEKEYRDLIAKADEAFFDKEISIARFYYNKASAMKKDEEYPKIKLKDIKKLIEQDELDQANQEYQKIVDAGDEAFKSENYSMARYNYNKALTMKPGEKYPKDQLKLIKEALDKKSN